MAQQSGFEGKIGEPVMRLWKQINWATLFALTILPSVVGAILPWFGTSRHVNLVAFRWTSSSALIAALIFTIRCQGGSFAQIASKRMWASAGTPMLLLAFIPTVVSLFFAILQLHGTDRIVSDFNIFQYPNKGVNRLYDRPDFWLQDWLTPVMGILLNIWVNILIFSNTKSQTRGQLFWIFNALEFLVALTYRQVTTHLYPHQASHHAIVSSSLAWFYFNSVVDVAANWIVYGAMERGFRPSLLPLMVALGAWSIQAVIFERPSDIYSLASHILGAAIVWFALRNSKWGVEKWTEYQQAVEI